MQRVVQECQIQTKIRKDKDRDIFSNKDIICKLGQRFFLLTLVNEREVNWIKPTYTVPPRKLGNRTTEEASFIRR